MHEVRTAAELEGLYGPVGRRAGGKVHTALDRHDRRFIGLSPFLVLATADADGLLDVSPRGDLPGYLRVLDDTHVVLPDRPGNNRIDSMRNLLTDPRVALYLLVPGLGETLRINGTAVISTDPELLALGDVDGRLPTTVLLVEVREVFYQCPRAVVRSALWDPARHVDPHALPSLDEVLADQVDGLSLEDSQRYGAEKDPLW